MNAAAQRTPHKSDIMQFTQYSAFSRTALCEYIEEGRQKYIKAIIYFPLLDLIILMPYTVLAYHVHILLFIWLLP